ARLAAYERVCGFPVGADHLPVTYPHVLGFPTAMRLMSGRAFPLPLLGLVHTSIRLTRHHPVPATAAHELTLHAEEPLPPRRRTPARRTTTTRNCPPSTPGTCPPASAAATAPPPATATPSTCTRSPPARSASPAPSPTACGPPPAASPPNRSPERPPYGRTSA